MISTAHKLRHESSERSSFCLSALTNKWQTKVLSPHIFSTNQEGILKQKVGMGFFSLPRTSICPSRESSHSLHIWNTSERLFVFCFSPKANDRICRIRARIWETNLFPLGWLNLNLPGPQCLSCLFDNIKDWMAVQRLKILYKLWYYTSQLYPYFEWSRAGSTMSNGKKRHSLERHTFF